MRFLKKNKFIVSLIARTAFFIVKLLFYTLRIEVQGKEVLENITKGSGSILAFWHNQIILSLFLKKFILNMPKCPVISKSQDGELLSAFISCFANTSVIRVGHKTRHQALRTMVTALEENKLLLITPDGPRGPVYKVKPGIFFCLDNARVPLFPIHFEAKKSWSLRTWDKLKIPYPFTKVTVTFKEPIYFDTIDRKALLEKALSNEP